MRRSVSFLRQKAAQIRRQILEMISRAGKGHIGGAFSCTDILVSLYYDGIIRFDPKKKNWADRDRFILSKGHSAAALYAVLADLGFFPQTSLSNYGTEGCELGGHPDRSVPGVEVDSGSLGHGLGIGAGLALGAKMDGKDFIAVILLGDGECHEGSIWEAAMFASHHSLNNLTAIVDNNGICATDYLKNCVDPEPLDKKWQSFGWDVKTVNGHDFAEIRRSFNNIRNRKSRKPQVIIAKTIKGKGVSFMENNPAWHHAVPKGHDLEKARHELTRSLLKRAGG